MKIENLFIKRIKELPAEATTLGHKLALKGGYIHQTGAGLYTYSSIGFRVLQNIKQIICEELNKIGCQEINMPVISPLSLWRETGRENIDILLKFKNRAGTDSVINPTHEEIVTDYARGIINSYKQLPISPNSLCLYQIQTKYRDELRVRAGLIRCREFMMKDAYSFHVSMEDLDNYYDIMKDTYLKIYERIGLRNVVVAEAPGGDMGGNVSHEFQMLNDSGEDTIYTCKSCGVSYNKEILETQTSHSCPKCGGDLKSDRGIEIGNIFKLNDKYSKPMKCIFNDANGEQKNVVMGCYGIGVSRVFGCLLEQNTDDKTIVFNREIAPFKIHIVSIGNDGDVVDFAMKLHNDLEKYFNVIVDTTDDRAGSKFANADLIGAPIRIVVSRKNMDKGVCEMKYFGLSGGYPQEIKISEVESRVKEIIL